MISRLQASVSYCIAMLALVIPCSGLSVHFGSADGQAALCQFATVNALFEGGHVAAGQASIERLRSV